MVKVAPSELTFTSARSAPLKEEIFAENLNLTATAPARFTGLCSQAVLWRRRTCHVPMGPLSVRIVTSPVFVHGVDGGQPVPPLKVPDSQSSRAMTVGAR